MLAAVPPTENRPLTGNEQCQVLDRVNELLELRYRSGVLDRHDDLLDALTHTLLTRAATSRRAHQISRNLLTHWGNWDQVRQAPEDDLTVHLRAANLRPPRIRRVQELLRRVHTDTTGRGLAGTTLNWLHQETDADAAAYLATLPHITGADATRVAREALIPSNLDDDPRAARILTRLGLVASHRDDAPHEPSGKPRPDPKPNSGPTPNLPRGIDPESLRQNLVHHSRAVCHAKTPDCRRCPLISFCPSGRNNHPGDDRPVAVEAFAGGGGLGEGFTQAGFDVAIAVELDRDAAQTYRHNHPGTVVVEADATTITAKQLLVLAPRAREATALVAGPPCQGYSAAGPRQANDYRNILYEAVIALAGQLNPRFIVIENVPGMRRVGGESYVQAVLDALQAAEYNAKEYLLRACDYGVPQLRRRMIFLAQRIDAGEAPAAPKPTHCPGGKCEHRSGKKAECTLAPVPTVLDTLEADGLPALESGQIAEFLPAGQGRQPVTNASTMTHSPEVIEKIKSITVGAGPISYRRLHPTIARTIVAGHRALPVHPTLNRTISVREAARIQGFNDGHVFAGPRSKQPLQVANAVPPTLGRMIAEQLLGVMDQDVSQPMAKD